jgi:uncharacterized membrane protein YhaH (DUF805 family)
VPWVAWFGFQILINGPRSENLSNAFWSMLIVPIGGPVLFFLIAWVVAGFQQSKLKPETQSAATPHYQPLHTHRLPHDFYAVISRAVGELTINSFVTRRELYRGARIALQNQLGGQERSHTKKEWRALEDAILKVEKESAKEELYFPRGIMNWLKLFFSFSGRANRAEYWLGLAIVFLITIVPVAVVVMLLRFKSEGIPDRFLIANILGFPISLIVLAIQVKRLHDLDLSGWWALGFFVADRLTAFLFFLSTQPHWFTQIEGFLSVVFLSWLGSGEGTPGDNRFGPYPIYRKSAPDING